ncbi:MAG: type VI secretion system-associated FHA domain protein [Candidatus Electrothrix sp. GW3-4]|uniref:type VI secretion system-associated FHA domain protein n=1 Tax=Candidatus Electrothrix sp. GW3-4 TaxID=3126740 RepID=UPI0030CAE757
MNCPELTDLVQGVKAISARGSGRNADVQASLETYLLRELRYLEQGQRQEVIEQLIECFAGQHSEVQPVAQDNDKDFLHFCSLLLGYRLENGELATEELQQQLNKALTSVFETINRLIRTVNMTLIDDGRTEETIRFLISEQLDSGSASVSLEEHLDQIRTAFVTSHRAFKRAVQVTVEKILTELDPEVLAKTADTGLKFGPLRKAEVFEQYNRTFAEFRHWFDSGRCMEDFLRSFEQQYSEILRQTRR